MKSIITTILLLGSIIIVTAQSPQQMQEDQDNQKKAMAEFAWMIGKWEGTAWSQMGNEESHTIQMKEEISYDLDETIVVVKGKGSGENGEMLHNARAIISYNARTEEYQWHAWRIPGGIFAEHKPEISENGFTWTMETPRGEMKYSAHLGDEGVWLEIGEFSSDGENWFKFFEMTLKRK